MSYPAIIASAIRDTAAQTPSPAFEIALEAALALRPIANKLGTYLENLLQAMPNRPASAVFILK